MICGPGVGGRALVERQGQLLGVAEHLAAVPAGHLAAGQLDEVVVDPPGRGESALPRVSPSARERSLRRRRSRARSAAVAASSTSPSATTTPYTPAAAPR